MKMQCSKCHKFVVPTTANRCPDCDNVCFLPSTKRNWCWFPCGLAGACILIMVIGSVLVTHKIEWGIALIILPGMCLLLGVPISLKLCSQWNRMLFPPEFPESVRKHATSMPGVPIGFYSLNYSGSRGLLATTESIGLAMRTGVKRYWSYKDIIIEIVGTTALACPKVLITMSDGTVVKLQPYDRRDARAFYETVRPYVADDRRVGEMAIVEPPRELADWTAVRIGHWYLYRGICLPDICCSCSRPAETWLRIPFRTLGTVVSGFLKGMGMGLVLGKAGRGWADDWQLPVCPEHHKLLADAFKAKNCQSLPMIVSPEKNGTTVFFRNDIFARAFVDVNRAKVLDEAAVRDLTVRRTPGYDDRTRVVFEKGNKN